MRKLLFLFSLLMLCINVVIAQQRKITGTVSDNSGLPVSGASVQLKGSTSGTITGSDGSFSILASSGDILEISAINYATISVKIEASSSVGRIKLESQTSVMDEIIVTAGGIKTKRKELGTASSVVRSEELVAGKATNIAGALQGKVAGLQINAVGSGANPSYRVVLRGQRSITGNNQALLVLDNVIVPNELLGNLNPEDVQDIVVLNGAGAAALYGSSASNGAVIITTKKGKKGRPQINFSNTTTIQEIAFFPKIQKKFGAGGTAYGTDINGQPEFSYLENQSYGPAFDGIKRPLGPALEDGSQDSAYYSFNEGHNKFWEKGITNQSDFSFSSADEVSSLYLSGQYSTTKGTTPGDKFNRTTLRVNGTRKILDMVSVSYNTAYIQNRYDITSQTGNMYVNMLNMPSNVDITKYKNWRTDPFSNPNGFYNPWYQNPYFTADNYRTYSKNDYLTANVEIKVSPIAGLDLVARQGISTRNFSYKNTQREFKYTEYAKHTDASSKSDIAGSVSDGSLSTTQLISDAYAQYNHKRGDFSFNLIAGGQWRQDELKAVDVSANGLVVPDLFNVSIGVGTPGASESNAKARQIGVYGDLRIGYKDYLFLHGTARQDWVSILDPGNRGFFYPSVDISFIASDAIEAIRNSNAISYLKLRAGWSKVGQVNLGGTFGAYQLVPTSGQANGFPYGSLAGFTIGNTLVATGLKPEITKGYEFGADMNFLKDRLITSLTYYNTKTDNQTITTSISSATGYTSLRGNVGQTQSQGIEAALHYTLMRTRDWNITVGGNYTYLDNKVNYITADLPILNLNTTGSAISAAQAGQVFPVIRGFDYKRDPLGRVIVDRITGLPTKSDTVSTLGNAVPRHRLSMDGSIRFKNFTLSLLFEYRGGYQIFNGIGTEMDWSGTGYRTAVYNRQRFVFPNSVYTDPSDPTKYVENTDVLIKNGNGNNGFWSDGINRDVTSNYITSGDFWKLREMSLSYDVPVSLLQKMKFVKGITVSIQGRNLLMWMAKDNYYTDPEYTSGGNGTNGVGLNSIDQTPPSRYYGGTLLIKF